MYLYPHNGDLRLREQAAILVITMPPRQAPSRVAAMASGDKHQGANPGSFQLPPYWEDRPELWFWGMGICMKG